MSAEPMPLRPGVTEASPTRGRRNPAQSARRRVEELLRGDARQARRAMSHGVFADVLAAPDMLVEVALIEATHPALEARDRRLVEAFAMAQVQRNRCVLALGADLGATDQAKLATLTSYEARLGDRASRLEAAVHEREQQRIRERAASDRSDGLARYRGDGGAS